MYSSRLEPPLYPVSSKNTVSGGAQTVLDRQAVFEFEYEYQYDFWKTKLAISEKRQKLWIY